MAERGGIVRLLHGRELGLRESARRGVVSRLRLRESQAGLYECCVTPGGVRHGPARTWFSTGPLPD